MKNIIVGFSRPKKWKPFSSLIMWWDKSDVSHTYLKFKSEDWQEDFIYQASHSRTNFVGGEFFEEENIVVEEFTISVEDSIESKIGQLCVKREGKPYGMIQAIGIAIVNSIYLISFGKIKIKRNPFRRGDNEVVCVEEVAKILDEVLNIKSPLDLDMVSVKPFESG